jgi:hypothetical protein
LNRKGNPINGFETEWNIDQLIGSGVKIEHKYDLIMSARTAKT